MADDPDYVEGQRLTAAGAMTSGASYATTGFIPVVPGMTYIRTGMTFNGAYTRICTYSSGRAAAAVRAVEGDRITIQDGENYLRFSLYITDKGTTHFAGQIQSKLREIDSKTIKTRIDYDDATKTFSLRGVALNYQELHDVHLLRPDFAFVVYGDRAYLLSYVQDDPAQMREMRYQSTIAVTGADGLSYNKTSCIYVTSSDGIAIAGVRVSDVNSENSAYRAQEINDSNRESGVWYPSNRAVVGFVEGELSEIKSDIS